MGRKELRPRRLDEPGLAAGPALAPALAPPDAKTTQASLVFAQLRADILQGRTLPDTKLRSEDLRLRYNTGLSPLREALMRLSTEGLVILEDQRGFRVAPISRSDLLDVTQMREELESLALRKSIALGDDLWEGNLLSTFHQLEKCVKMEADAANVRHEWEVRHAAFHFALVAACDSRWLLKFRQVLYDQSDRYRRLSLRYLRYPRNDLEEHRALMHAVLGRDEDEACRLIRSHIRTTTDIVLAGATFD